MVVLLFAAQASVAWGQGADDPLLVRGVPYDELKLKPNAEQTEAPPPQQLVPLDIDPRRPPTRAEGETIKVRLLRKPSQQYEVNWADVESLRLFEQLVLDQAAALVAAGRFDLAHESYAFLEAREAGYPGLQAALVDCLIAEAKASQSAGKLSAAWINAIEAHRRDSDHEEIKPLVGSLADARMTELVGARQYPAARTLLGELSDRYADHPIAAKWTAQLTELAGRGLTVTRQLMAGNRYREAHDAAFRTGLIWPTTAGLADVYNELNAAYPLVRIGVWTGGNTARTLPAGLSANGFRRNWTALRQSPLVGTRIVEPVAGESGELAYRLAIGEWTAEESTARLSIAPGLTWTNPADNSAGSALSAADVSARLLATLRGDTAASARLRSQLVRLNMIDERTVELVLREPMSSPTALLNVDLRPWTEAPSSAKPWTFGPYTLSTRETEIAFTQPAGKPGPREIVEIGYDDFGAALKDLRQGMLASIDRLPSGRRDYVSNLPGIKLVDYAQPTVQILVFNQRQPALARLDVREGLTRCLDGRALLATQAASSVGLPTGWLIGRAEQNWALALLGRSERQGVKPSSAWRLAHAPTEAARRSALKLAEQLAIDGMGPLVELVSLSPETLADPATAARDWDLLLVDWHIMDPAIDWPTMLDWAGVPRDDPALLAALRPLQSATASPAEASAALHRLGDWVTENRTWVVVGVTTEAAVVHESLAGLKPGLATLYQDASTWRFPPPLPEAADANSGN
jgi:hypothetical protein